MTVRRSTPLLVTLVALLGLAGCGQESDSATDSGDSTVAPTASASPSDDATPGASTMELTADSTTAGKCMVPNAGTLANLDTAFEGTVTDLGDGTATLSVDQWYAGDDQTDTVTVTAPSAELQDLLMAVDFQAGRTYLVSAQDGQVTLCGFTAEKSGRLESIYAKAFES